MFYPLNLLLIANINETTKIVLLAVTKRIDQFAWTLVFTLFMLIFFAMWYMTDFTENAGDFTECNTLLKCFANTINFGIRNGGGIGDNLTALENDDKHFFKYLIFVMFFFFIVNVIALNVIFGIIIDTFSELRDLQDQRKFDRHNICFVCGFSREDFSKYNADFDKHIEEKHYPWN